MSLTAEMFYFETLTGVKARVTLLEENIGKEHIGDIKDEVNKCEALLSNLRDQAMIQQLDITPYFDHIADIKTALERIKRRIEKRRGGFWSWLKEKISGFFGWLFRGRSLSGRSVGGYLE